MKKSGAFWWARWALVVACASVLALVGASCRSVLGLEGYEESVDAICKIIDRCTDDPTRDCRERVGTRLQGAETANNEPWSKWLSDLTAHQCLDSCGNARRCLDTTPICGTTTCMAKDDCCGFVGGRKDCNLDTHLCCSPEGTNCASDDDCCPGKGPCSPITKTCGGIICRPQDSACTNSFECCSKVCRDGACADQICGDKGFECTTNEECCSGFCDRAGGGSIGQCGTSACGILGTDCEADGDCCDGNCFHPEGSNKGICSNCGDALPNGVDCGVDSQCCSGSCNDTFYQCGEECASNGGECKSDADCCEGTCGQDNKCFAKCSTSTCTVDGDCCSGVCVAGQQCAPQCEPVAGCLHGVCSVGSPLQQDCKQCLGPNGEQCNVEVGCVNQICTTDPYCCCVQWDSLCVAHVFEEPKCTMGCNP